MNAELGIDMQSSHDDDGGHYHNNSDAATPPITSMKQYKPPPSIQMVPNESGQGPDFIPKSMVISEIDSKDDQDMEPMSSRSDDNSKQGLISSHHKKLSKQNSSLQFSEKRATNAGIIIYAISLLLSLCENAIFGVSGNEICSSLPPFRCSLSSFYIVRYLIGRARRG